MFGREIFDRLNFSRIESKLDSNTVTAPVRRRRQEATCDY
jgi:hypothetical protein